MVGDNKGGEVASVSAELVISGGEVARGDEAGGGDVAELPFINNGGPVIDGETKDFFFLFTPLTVDC